MASSPVVSGAPALMGVRFLRLWLRVVKTAAALLVVGIAMLLGGDAFEEWRRHVTTDNAQVKARLVAISSDVDGRVTAVNVRDDQRVSRGDVLFHIDREPFALHLNEMEARLNRARHQVEALRSRYRLVRIEVERAQARAAYLQRDHARHLQLSTDGSGTRAQLDASRYELSAARLEAEVLRERAKSVLADLGGDADTPVESHASFQRVKAERDRSARELARTIVRAPVDGYVTNLGLEPGEYVEAGKKTFTIVAADRAWVVANLKESELEQVIPGQRARIVVDAYPGHEIGATVSSISPATGGVFSLLPPQNASGNWVKVVQRVPVRLELGDTSGLALRVGMSARVSIQVADPKARGPLAGVIGALVARLGFDTFASP